MSIVAWIVLGVLAGVLANRFSGKRGTGLLEDVLLGTAGASFAGFAVNSLAAGERGQLNLWSLAASASRPRPTERPRWRSSRRSTPPWCSST